MNPEAWVERMYSERRAGKLAGVFAEICPDCSGAAPGSALGVRDDGKEWRACQCAVPSDVTAVELVGRHGLLSLLSGFRESPDPATPQD